MKKIIFATKNNQLHKKDITSLDEYKFLKKIKEDGYEFVKIIYVEEENDKNQEDKNKWVIRMAYSDKSLNLNVDDEDVRKAIYAFIKQTNLKTKVGLVRGKDIISITPCYNSILGWNIGYQPSSEDMRIIQKHPDCIEARQKLEKLNITCKENPYIDLTKLEL